MEDIFDTISRMYGELDDDTECDSASDKDKPDLSNVSDGEEFEFRGIRFIRLGFEQDGILCITRDSMMCVPPPWQALVQCGPLSLCPLRHHSLLRRPRHEGRILIGSKN